MEDNFSARYKTILDRNGNKHRVYSVLMKDLPIVTEFTTKYNIDYFAMYAYTPKFDEEGKPEITPDGKIDFNNGFLEDVIEMVYLALDKVEDKEKIKEWLDITIAEEIIRLFIGLSQFKKNEKSQKEMKPTGEILKPQ